MQRLGALHNQDAPLMLKQPDDGLPGETHQLGDFTHGVRLFLQFSPSMVYPHPTRPGLSADAPTGPWARLRGTPRLIAWYSDILMADLFGLLELHYMRDAIGGTMAKHKYVVEGPEAGATGAPVTKALFTYEGDALELDGGIVSVIDYAVPGLKVAVIRLAEGQSIKRQD